SVYIEARNPVHLTSVRLTPDVPGERVRAELSLSAAAPEPAGLRLTLVNPTGDREEHRFELTGDRFDALLPVRDPLLWDTETPNLYRVEAALLAGADGEEATLDLVT